MVLPGSSLLFFLSKRRCHSCRVSWHLPGNIKRTCWSLVSLAASVFNAPGPAAATPKACPLSREIVQSPLSSYNLALD